MAGFTIQLEGAASAIAGLEALVDRLENPTDLYDALGSMLAGSTQNRFETERDPAGAPWPSSIRAQLDGGKTLTDTMALRQSITWQASATGVAVGTDLIYAGVHQLGATIEAKNSPWLHFSLPGVGRIQVKSVTIPARPFLGISDEDEEEIIAITSGWVVAPVGGPEVMANG